MLVEPYATEGHWYSNRNRNYAVREKQARGKWFEGKERGKELSSARKWNGSTERRNLRLMSDNYRLMGHDSAHPNNAATGDGIGFCGEL